MNTKPPKLRFAGSRVVEWTGVWVTLQDIRIEFVALNQLTEQTERRWLVGTVFGGVPSIADTMPGPNGWLPIEED